MTLTLADEIDVSRGDIICAAKHPAEVSDQFEAQMLWMDAEAMLPGRPYIIKAGTSTVPGSIERIKHKINVNTHGEDRDRNLDAQ